MKAREQTSSCENESALDTFARCRRNAVDISCAARKLSLRAGGSNPTIAAAFAGNLDHQRVVRPVCFPSRQVAKGRGATYMLNRRAGGSGTLRPANSWNGPCGVALGFRHAAIVDLSPMGHQPVISFSTRFVPILNGEVCLPARIIPALSLQLKFPGAA
jgi:hypothetical protein